jgi:TetR/AcrR family transcriptional regulator
MAMPKASRGRGTRERILEVATEMFSQRGYSACPVAEIVARAGVTKPVLYYYFGSKEGLFRAILEEASNRHEELLEKAVSRQASVIQKVTELFKEVYEEVTQSPHLFRLLHDLAFYNSEKTTHGLDIESFPRRMKETLAAMAREGMEKGELARSDPEDVALLLMAVLSLCIDLDQCYPHNADPGRMERLLGLALAGLGLKRG